MQKVKSSLLYYGGKNLHDIYDTICNIKYTYDDIKGRLTKYIEPKINLLKYIIFQK